ncbi:GerMN domain-containing protein [Clostridium cylindrosporum]|uniref:GerMN domain-containing protein n=1 Tax=Clostridium cylindrosporum DSM 605 TaxID=1121307 RepID=A0A0J8D976_CLOCY|nr:GerMN domain-containing protein [Clostridium cylindrosporum]KMT22417.1 hypothetical protein CLCY_14c00150 [Clostridium cylindrosporum DSM 605]
MKKKLLLYVYGITIMSFIICGLYFSGMMENTYNRFFGPRDELHTQVNSNKLYSDKSIPFISYIPDSDGKLLEPTVIDISPKGNIYMNLINSLMAYSKDYFKGDFKLISVTRDSSVVKVKLSSSFKEDLSLNEEKFYLSLMSIVNTLSEINNVDYVEFYSGSEKLVFKGTSRFQRNENLIVTEFFDSPDSVLREQMKLEQRGEFLKAYLLMSYKHSPNRKMYHEYLSEMQEIKSIGFLSGDFKIKETKINDGVATVVVEFQNVSNEGTPVNTSNVTVKCIYIDKGWFVDWVNVD